MIFVICSLANAESHNASVAKGLTNFTGKTFQRSESLTQSKAFRKDPF